MQNPMNEEKNKANQPTIVCLCGSSRWPELHHRVMMEETLKGNIVLPMGLYGHADYPVGAKAITSDADPSNEVKKMLNRLHFQKIDLADEVIVVVPEDGYYGGSTVAEIEYAKERSKPVRFWKDGSTDAESNE